VPLLSHGDKASLICRLYEVGDRWVWYSHVPGEGEQMLALRAAALEAVTFGCPIPTRDGDTGEPPRDAYRLPIKVQYERKPSRLKESYRWDRTIRHFLLEP